MKADITKQREFDIMMRDEARKRDYGNGVPRWSVYYHGNAGGESAQPGHLKSAPAIGRAAAQSLRPREFRQKEMNHQFRIRNANLVTQSVGSIIDHPDEETRVDPVEAAAIQLIEACDVDGDGQLDLFEIIKALMHRPHLLLPLGLGAGSTELQILEMIKKADEDSSGHVTKEELMSFLIKNQTGKRGIEGMDQGYRAFDSDQNHTDPEMPNRDFGAPLISRPGTRELGMPSTRHPQNHVCRNEFFTKGENPGESADVMASRYYKEVGRPFEGQLLIKTCQKPRSLGKGKEWENEIQPTVSPFRRSSAAGWKSGLRNEP